MVDFFGSFDFYFYFGVEIFSGGEHGFFYYVVQLQRKAFRAAQPKSFKVGSFEPFGVRFFLPRTFPGFFFSLLRKVGALSGS